MGMVGGRWKIGEVIGSLLMIRGVVGGCRKIGCRGKREKTRKGQTQAKGYEAGRAWKGGFLLLGKDCR